MILKKLATAMACCCLISSPALSQDQAEKSNVEKWLDGETEWAPEITYDGRPITIRFNSFLGAQTPVAKISLRAFERLKEDTGGKLVVRPFWNNTLADGNAGGFEAVSSGVADLGTCYIMLSPGGFDLQLGFQMPYLIKRSTPGSMAAHSVYPEYARDTYEARGVYLGRIAYTPPNQMITSSKPMRTLDDVQGNKIWATGNIPTQIVSALGGAPVAVAPAELYISLQTGVLDGAPMHDAGTITFRLNELAKYRTEANLWANPTEFCINPTFFNSLPDDLKATFYHWLQLWNFAETKIYYDDLAREGNETMRERGIEFIDLDETEQKRWDEALAPVEQNWLDTMSARNLPGEEFLAQFRSEYSRLEAMNDDELFQIILENPTTNLISGYDFQK
ncbi:hypothetical protein FPY71_07370 [Aureimonas fodinaquatilis]|uniref:TRAP transporter substrate-binding protein n=1 Tax=Aureimonas fodinaquatilis TaxID=2565783 RepID=A0A5B0DWV4_9HYPH|nr:TRAP transporter substrate-binding protein DctP [Aureimonas fodinaquatilis]KAA0970335.1 hypothetical protein FPY71_07370 [Aureimonas fodinaquatilis]